MATPNIAALQKEARDDDMFSDVVPSRAVSSSRQTSEKAGSSKSDGENEFDPDDDEVEDSDEEHQGGDVEMGEPGSSKLTASRAKFLESKERKKKSRNAKKEQVHVLDAKKKEMDSVKLADSMKRYQYLLGQTDLFEHFLTIKKERDPVFAKMVDDQAAKVKAGKGKKKATDNRHRKTEKEEDEELLGKGEGEEDDGVMVFEESPPYVKGGQMRDYQVQGLNWMVSLHHNGISGILADEMGLGKTLQTISFLGYLKFHQGTKGPHLVVVPKSTLQNWDREFHKWVPGFDTVILQGTKDERAEIINNKLLPGDFDVCITSYEMCLREKATFKKFQWEYIVIDEAHRIKNADSLLSQIVRVFNSRGRLLITGTPLQNNLQELWALLNFILPDVFSSSEDFDAWFQMRGDNDQDAVVKQLHKVLRPFLLRRVKADVEHSLLPKKEINIYVGMTEMQRKWYRMILEKDIDAVNGAGGKKEGKTRLLNIVMQLRKCCNHPYLFDGAEPGPPYTTDEHIIQNAGKMVILDKLLTSMKAKGSRVLIFSQMSRVLDILEDYMMFRNHQYSRIDGGTNHEDRITAIDEYNAPGSEKFAFLLTTRAGGLGINLVTADVVVLFDSDWNPQADLQAMDRAHRIGQTKQVYVFRFITENAVEERILERATQKLRLDQLVIQQGRAQQAAKAAQNKDDLLDMIQHGAEKIIASGNNLLIDDDIDEIIQRGESRTAELASKYDSLNLDDLNNFKSESMVHAWEGEDFGNKKKGLGMLWIEPAKRERKTNYSVDGYYKEAMRIGQPKSDKPKVPRAPKQLNIQDHQFYPPRLVELQERETNAFKRSQSYQVPLPDAENGLESTEQREARRQALQLAIDTAEPLDDDEDAEKDELATKGFSNWTKRHFQQFVNSSGRYGRNAYDQIASDIDGKEVDDVKIYAAVFWERYKDMADWERVIQKITEGESKIHERDEQSRRLTAKVKSHTFPMQELHLSYGQNKGKQYTEEEDRFLIVRLEHWGLNREDVYELIKKDVGDWPLFRFDWFLKSRTPQEISRRCSTLIALIAKEDDEKKNAVPKKVGGKKRGIDEVKGGGGSSRASTPASEKKAKAVKRPKTSDVVKLEPKAV
ncbi:SNF2 family N-terminal domain-containing protein [Mrakia frigida]|uniref:SNF2 family N-terminal domain-containing protein n=1 Tax=Mrakia frigida TaxID=29902 RepID=UPI003FCBEF19